MCMYIYLFTIFAAFQSLKLFQNKHLNIHTKSTLFKVSNKLVVPAFIAFIAAILLCSRSLNGCNKENKIHNMH